MDRIARAGDLKVRLLEFGLEPRFAAEREAALAEASDETAEDGVVASQLIDSFLLEHELAGGGTVLDRFVAARTDLSDEDREMLLAWRDPVEGVFRVDAREDGALVTFNLVDEQVYRMHSNLGAEGTAPVGVGEFLMTRLVPVGEDWMISGEPVAFAAEDAADVYVIAEELAWEHPEQVFRNPEKLAEGWRLQAEHRDSFIELFGSDEIVVPAEELAERMEELDRHHYERTREPGSPEWDDFVGEAGSRADLHVEEWAEAETTGLIYDPEEGLGVYADFGLAEEAFADPDLVVKRRYRDVISMYVRDETVPPVPIRRLAARDTAKADRVFRTLLNKPNFSWERDGEDLLRRYKPEHYENPPLPLMLPQPGYAPPQDGAEGQEGAGRGEGGHEDGSAGGTAEDVGARG
ncbi:hypothetical protein LG943_08500 [Streptomonospora sp. S1-112]|uniref:Uncharacterized protein n=1 Tax=Streptomonospora mangrovi TaxID=2883123 RepID=A0A9X3NPL4_9ACTN|nr:hypothetical protein [Streptomonospora mangrovi]MDA0564365.1 hypothetical protein [Streptomonospora mangrovi]